MKTNELFNRLHRVLFYLTVLLLPTQLGYHFWPEWAAVLGRRVDYLAPTIFLTGIFIICTLIVWCISSISNIKYQISNKKIKFQKYLLPSVICIFVVINCVYAGSWQVAVYQWVKTLEFLLFGYYIVKTKPSLSNIILILSVSVFYSSLIAIGQFMLQHSIGGLLWYLGERTFDINTPGIARINLCQVSGVTCHEILRSYGTFPHPNVLGGYIAVLLPLIIIQLSNYPIIQLSNKTIPFVKLLRISTVLFGLVALVLSFSRSAWVAAVVGVGVVLYKKFFSNRNVFTSIKSHDRSMKYEAGIMNQELRTHNYISPFILLLTFILLTSYFILQIPSIKESESYVVREKLSTAAISMWRESPFVGVGLGNFLVMLPHFLVSREIYFLQPVHNIYLLLLSEVGIVGICLIAIFIITLLKYEARSKKYDIKQTYIHSKIVLRTSLFLLLALGLVDHYPLTLQQGQLLLTVLLSFSIR